MKESRPHRTALFLRLKRLNIAFPMKKSAATMSIS